MNDRVIINPLMDLQIKDLPVIVLVDDARSFIGWGIKHHTNGNYNHAMIMTKLGAVATQNWVYKEMPLQEYLKPQLMLKFWTYTPMSGVSRRGIEEMVIKDLKKPWWGRRYDFLGIVGQFTGIKWIQSPWANFCSEIVAKYLRTVPQLTKTIPKEPSPSGLNDLFNKTPGFVCLGYWFCEGA